MQELVIEYTLGARHPGYRFRPPTDGIDAAVLNAVWRQAMPRGQGWGAEAFAGACSLKGFPAGPNIMAVSQVTVTGQRDELGRRGIRQASVRLLAPAEYLAFLDDRIARLPADVREEAGQRFVGYLWRRILDRALLRGGRRVVLTAPYAGPASWLHVEALALRLVTSPGIRAFEGWGPLTPFTTLALDWRDEGQVVGVPGASAQRGRGASVIDVAR